MRQETSSAVEERAWRRGLEGCKGRGGGGKGFGGFVGGEESSS